MSEMATQFEKARSRRFRPYPDYKDSGFEWLGEVPAHWEVKKWRYCCHVAAGQVAPDDEQFRDRVLIAPNHIESSTGRILHTETADEQGSISGKYLVQPGDIIYSKIRPALNKVCISTGDWLCSADMYPVSITDNRLKTRFLLYFMLSEPFVRLMVDESMRVAMPKVNRDKLAACPLLVPEPAEQLALAAFLDHETAKIDGLVERKERLIELLQEKRTALITRTVTRGLAPDVPVKDSGVEWLGEIPTHWEVKRLRRVVSKFVDYRGKTPEKSPSGVSLVTAKNIKNQSIDFSLSEEFIPENLYPQWMVRGRPERGDVLITTEAPLGETAQIVDTDIALAQRIILLKADSTKITNDYLKYHFVADFGRMELHTRATGSTALGIKASHLKASLLTVPPICEQEEISRAISSEIANVDMLVAKVKEAIDHLQEFRTALISAAVTGKIDVRTVSDDATAGQGETS